jgi:hypothetical protein
MNQRHAVLAILTGLSLLMGTMGRASTQVPTPSPPTASKPQQTPKELTSIIAGFLSDTASEGRTVTIVGYYRGWDLLGEANQPPPVTRSDWVIKDKSGALYIQANGVEIERLDKLGSGEALLPSDKGATKHILRVTGIVRFTPNLQCYIEPTQIELVE